MNWFVRWFVDTVFAAAPIWLGLWSDGLFGHAGTIKLCKEAASHVEECSAYPEFPWTDILITTFAVSLMSLVQLGRVKTKENEQLRTLNVLTSVILLTGLLSMGSYIAALRQALVAYPALIWSILGVSVLTSLLSYVFARDREPAGAVAQQVPAVVPPTRVELVQEVKMPKFMVGDWIMVVMCVLGSFQVGMLTKMNLDRFRSERKQNLQ